MSWRGADTLKGMLVAINDISPDPQNLRVHSTRNLTSIKGSLEAFGQRKPIVARAGVVIAGNGTLLAARALEWTQIAVIDADDLTHEQALAYAIADNKTGDLAEWDLQELGAIFRELPEELRSSTGFLHYEQEPLLQESWTPPAVDDQTTVHEHVDMVTIKTSSTEGTIIRAAIDKVKGAEKEDLSDGRALELICADYLA